MKHIYVTYGYHIVLALRHEPSKQRDEKELYYIGVDRNDAVKLAIDWVKNNSYVIEGMEIMELEGTVYSSIPAGLALEEK